MKACVSALARETPRREDWREETVLKDIFRHEGNGKGRRPAEIDGPFSRWLGDCCSCGSVSVCSLPITVADSRKVVC